MTLDEYSKELKEIGGNLYGYLAYVKGIADGLESIYKQTDGKQGVAHVDIDELALDRSIQVKYMAVALLID